MLLHVPSGTYLRLDGSGSDIVDLLVEHGDAGRLPRPWRTGSTFHRAGHGRRTTVVTALTGLRAERVGPTPVTDPRGGGGEGEVVGPVELR